MDVAAVQGGAPRPEGQGAGEKMNPAHTGTIWYQTGTDNSGRATVIPYVAVHVDSVDAISNKMKAMLVNEVGPALLKEAEDKFKAADKVTKMDYKSFGLGVGTGFIFGFGGALLITSTTGFMNKAAPVEPPMGGKIK